jgi:glyoxylase-like metal-dependent hydrolase (beta-lactamase superfamily II)
MTKALAYPFSKPPLPTELIEVAEDVFWLRMPMPFKLDHINLYLLRDHDGWWVIDTGLNTSMTKSLWEEIAAKYFSESPLKGIICTHYHNDHTGMSGWLVERFGAKLYMSNTEFLTLIAMKHMSDKKDKMPASYGDYCIKAGMEPAEFKALLDMLSITNYMPVLPFTYYRLSEGDFITIGKHRWQVFIGSGHSPEHVCLYSDSINVLISGDQVLPKITSNVCVSPSEPNANPLKNWLDSLDSLKVFPEDCLVLPSHQLPFVGLHARLAELKLHHMSALEKITNYCLDGSKKVMDVTNLMFPRLPTPIDKFLATGEALAHLNYLVEMDQLTVIEDDENLLRYSTNNLPPQQEKPLFQAHE